MTSLEEDQKNATLLSEVATYYSEKLAMHGTTARGVDWNGEESQQLRFQQLYKLIAPHTSFSVNDLGCGYGAFYDFLCHQSVLCSYRGIDVSHEMIQAARERYPSENNVQFIESNAASQIADFSVASGIFNVRLNHTEEEWLFYIKSTLDHLNDSSQMGFGFNALTSYSDKNKKREYLYYADPCLLFDWCKRYYSQDVALLHDYGLYEFTILVRKS